MNESKAIKLHSTRSTTFVSLTANMSQQRERISEEKATYITENIIFIFSMDWFIILTLSTGTSYSQERWSAKPKWIAMGIDVYAYGNSRLSQTRDCEHGAVNRVKRNEGNRKVFWYSTQSQGRSTYIPNYQVT